VTNDSNPIPEQRSPEEPAPVDQSATVVGESVPVATPEVDSEDGLEEVKITAYVIVNGDQQKPGDVIRVRPDVKRALVSSGYAARE
jgi:hypothetical protein